MTKTTTAGMDTHLPQEVTTLAMATAIERTDGTKFRLTTSSEAITIDIGDGDGEQVYSAQEGISRTNVESDAELNVDNLDIIGIFDNVLLKETELRRGLFDFADFKIFVFNHQKTADGIIKIFRGQFGEVIITKQDFFKVQVRSIVQVYSKQTGELYSKDCRADLGDIRCRVPIIFEEDAVDQIDRSFPVSRIKVFEAYQLGDFVAIPTVPSPDDCSQIIMNFEGTDGATSGVGFDNIGTDGTQPVINGTAQIDTAEAPAGGDSISSLLLDGNSDFLSWTDRAAWEFGTNPVTISTHFRLNATGAGQIIASQYRNTFSRRSWFVRVLATNLLEFQVFQTGATVDITLSGTTVLTAGVDHHLAVVRKNNGDWVMFLDGAIEAGPTTPTADPFNTVADLMIGAFDSSGVTGFFNGWIDSFELLIGFARWEAPFTPPTGNLTVASATLIWEDFGDRIYEVTTAGTSDLCVQTPDQTIGNTHSQGSAIMKANHSWMRFAEVTAVDSSDPRRIFTVTELTPTSGQTVGTNRLPSALGFPNDWFNGGAAKFEVGNNAGRAIEVRDFTEGVGSQVIELITDMPFDVVVGDKLRIFPGCDKTNAICISKFNSGKTFVGEPYVPGEDILGQYPDAR